MSTRATFFLGFHFKPKQGLVPRSRNPHSSARNTIARRIASARLAAPGRSLLAASNHAATFSGPMRSSGLAMVMMSTPFAAATEAKEWRRS